MSAFKQVKFSKGDRARVREGAPYTITSAGRLGTVRRVFDGAVSDVLFAVDGDDGEYPIESRWLEPLSATNDSGDTLDTLVRKANEGMEAIAELYKNHEKDVEMNALHSHESHFIPVSKNNMLLMSNGNARTFRVKPKPTFEPFTVSTGWDVKRDGDRLHIGCKTFDAKLFKTMLERMLGDSTQVRNTEGEFFGTRSGISHNTYTLPWSDAERVLSALKKAGI